MMTVLNNNEINSLESTVISHYHRAFYFLYAMLLPLLMQLIYVCDAITLRFGGYERPQDSAIKKKQMLRCIAKRCHL